MHRSATSGGEMRITTVGALALCAACGGSDDKAEGRDSGTATFVSEWPSCEEVLTPLGWDEAAPDGSVPSEVFAAVEGTTTSNFDFADGTTAPLTITVARSGDPQWVDAEAVYPASGVEIGIVCPDHVRIPASVLFRTGDGRLDESWTQDHAAGSDAYTTGLSREGMSLVFTADLEDLGGAWTLEGVDTSAYDYVELHLGGTVHEGVTSGEVSVMGQQTSGDAVSFGPVADVGTWGGAGE